MTFSDTPDGVAYSLKIIRDKAEFGTLSDGKSWRN
jgi:hypothetical protein